MRAIFINAMRAEAFESENTTISIYADNKKVSQALPSSVFFDNYHQAFAFYSSNPHSYTHIVTSCTPERGLHPIDKSYCRSKTERYLYDNHFEDMKSWLYQYKYSFDFLGKFKELNRSLQFIIYSGAGYSSKPTGAFGECLENFVGDFYYVPKTNETNEDIRKIKEYLKIGKVEISITVEDGKYLINEFVRQGIFINDKDLDTAVRLLVNGRKTNPIIEEFEDLLNSKHSEHDIDVFLRKNPEIFFESHFSEDLIIQPFLEGSSDYNKRPDFILKPIIPTINAKIVELKKITAQTIKNENRASDFSSNVKDAINQLRNYQNYFDDKANRDKFQLKFNTKVIKPTARLIIGKDYGDLSLEKILQLKDDYLTHKIEILSYHELMTIVKKNVGFLR